MLTELMEKFADSEARAETVDALTRLSDQQLADMGLHRDQLDALLEAAETERPAA